MVFEKFCGVWANHNYNPIAEDQNKPFAKWILNPDGTVVAYDYIDETGPTQTGTYEVVKKWKDENGNYYYHVKFYFALIKSTVYELWKLDKYNSVLEVNWSSVDYPENIDPADKHSDYKILYRY